MTVSLEGLTREEKLALLRRLREEEAGGAAPVPAAPRPQAPGGPADAPGRYPVSFAQRRLWFLDQLDPESSHNTIFRAVRLSGPIDEEALTRAVDALAARHEALRTRFEPTDGDPEQVVETPETIGRLVRRVDLSRVPAEEREAVLSRLAHEEAALPFDLGKAPLLRVVLVTLDPAAAERALLIAVHHIVADGWSLAVFFRELSELYEAEVERREPALPALELTYGEIARRQRARLDGHGLERQMAFWRGELDGAPDVLDLPTDRPRPALGTFRGSTVPVELTAEGSAAVERLAREERATPFMLLLAAFAAVLGRWSRQRDVLVGVPIAGRDAADAERVIGLFANTLVVRSELDGEVGTTFRDLVRRVRRRTLSALEHQETPFENLVEELAPTRDLSRNPLFQAMFALQNMPSASLSLGAARIEPIAVQRGLAKVDLTLDVRKTEGSDGVFRGYLEYNTDLFDRTTAERLARHFRSLAEAFAAAPDRPLAAHEMVGAAERRTLLAEGRGTLLPAPPGATVDSLFRAAAAERPDHPAVETAAGSWSYRDLRAGARRVAEALSARGLAPGDRVGVLASRSPEAIAAFLGVLEAGGAYVPLDPEYPADRLAYMVRDSGARLLLAGAPTGIEAPGVETVTLDREALFSGVEAGAEDAAPVRAPEPGRPAYVIYTSGTTGQPKGVVVPHRALVSHATGIRSEYGLTPDDRIYQFAATSFDIAGEEIYPSLAAGATLYLRPEGVTPSPEELVRTVAERELSVVNVPTPLWHEWVGELADGEGGRAVPPPCLRLVVVGTEGALPERLATWREALADLGLSPDGEDRPRWVNAYGPTEGTITATTFSPGRDTPRRLHRVPIGRPIANVHAVVLDPAGRLAGLGVPGELCLGGSNLAIGYLGKPAATAAVFTPDPYPPASPRSPSHPRGGKGTPPPDAIASEFGRRLYRTGDLVRQLPGGTIEFLGRTDDQVKVRGFRIEPAEVESALDAHPALREVAVVPVEAGPGDTRLVAYVAPEALPGPTDDDLRSFLGRRLPSYMIPAAFVTVESLPMTPAGKIDRKALPKPDWSGAAEGSIAPRGPLEELVAAIWSEVLEVPAVGVRDDFFRLGGHSLLATRVVSRLRDRMGVEVPLRRLFEAPTVEGLARVVAELRRGESVALAPIVPRDRQAEVPASFAQQRLWFLDRLEPGSVLYNMAFRIDLALDPAPAGESIDEAALARAIGEIVRRHESLRTTFERRADAPVQVIAPAVEAGAFELPVADLSGRDPEAGEAEARRLALDEARTPFDLAAGPLARFRLLRLPDGRRHLLFTAHHAVSDGWSTDLFLGELAALYDAFTRGEGSPLTEPPVQYGDFALWQRGWLHGDALAAMTDHWRRALDGAPRLLELPTDRPRPPMPSGAGARVPIAFDEATTAGVHDLARRLGATPFMVLLTAYAAVLARWSGQHDVPVGTPIAGRGRSELEGLIGFFANTLAVRADLRPGDAGRSPSFAEAVVRVREAALGAYAHQDLPFEKLVEELQPERNLSHHPVFQVFFAFQTLTAPSSVGGSPALSGGAPRLLPRLVPNDNRTARFDLALNLWEHAGRLRGFLEYATDLFDEGTLERMVEHLGVLLGAAAAAPETAVADLPLLTDAERRIVVEEGDRAGEAPEPDAERATIDSLFRERAAAQPSAEALSFEGESLTYGELAERASALARHLRRLFEDRGAGPEPLVGVHLERSLDMVVAVLGVMEAGAAYVPLDPEYPADRIAYMVEAAALAAVVTQDRLAPGLRDRLPLPPQATPAVVRIDAEWEAIAAAGGPGPEAAAVRSPDALAYVIFTSGSTGEPKGVQVAHRSVVSFLRSMAREPGFGAGDTLLAVTTLSFDIAGLELYLPLTTGGRVVVASRESVQAGDRLAEAVRRAAPTAMQATPVSWRLLLDSGWPARDGGGPPPKVLCGGEALPRELAGRLLSAGAELWNLYGPTETTIWSSALRVAEGEGAVPIGGPIAGTSLHVVEPSLAPAPLGVPGELVIGGRGLARGYLGRPALTAERFLPDPFSRAPGARLYRTGDLARRLPDGTFAFLGRIDHQVKVRGFRIELGEIESVLASHPAVDQAVAVVREDRPGDPELVAYTTAAGDEPAPPAELRARLEERLPAYMVPAVFVPLDALPLTPNGKVDRKALPAPDRGRRALADEYVAPRNAIEAKLAAIWAETLGLERVGVHDDFFELGGHSLRATQVTTRIEEAFGFEVPLRAIFDDRTIARLAERVAERELETLDASALSEALDEIDNLSEDELAALLGAEAAESSD